MQLLAGTLDIKGNAFEKSMWDILVEYTKDNDGILGFRNPTLGIRDTDEVPSFIIRSSKYGIMLFHVVNEKIISVYEDEEEYWNTDDGFIYSPDIILNNYYQQLISKLSTETKLYNRKENTLKISIKRYLVLSSNQSNDPNINHDVSEYVNSEVIFIDNFKDALGSIFSNYTQTIDTLLLDLVDSIIEGTIIYKKVRRDKMPLEPLTKNDFIKLSLNHTWKLDEVQRAVAMQIPAGPQRIRGLAGTGKTIILCMKAANAHKAFENFKILFVFKKVLGN